MTDPRESNPEPEIVDLPAGDRRSGTAVAPPGSTVGTRFGNAPVVDPAAPSAGMLPSLAAPGRKRTAARAGDGRQIVCEGLVRIYKVADLEVVALQGLDLVVERRRDDRDRRRVGQRQVDAAEHPRRARPPSAGRAVVAGHDLGRMGRRERTRYRRRVVGMIWQQTARNLLPYLTAQENVELPMTLDGRPDADRAGAATCSSSSVWPSGATTGRSVCRAASSSGSRSRSRSRTSPRCSSPTSRPASSTPRPRPRSSACCAGSTRSSGRRS